ncbi:hypothetical protein ELZ19_06775 [Brucella abortus]|uniref:DUF6011 domain-containing protein n=1 Tax=Brucella abortus TaxID=235 RepID=UPI0004E9004D|nr:DUF6011 domain-containing protein [Brucella abortus]KFH18417.1 hypothetical protein IB60_17050 [Brucella abortus LMN1]RUQ67353.1 hypothetical protein ELZ23_15610 [Brucella abortus]RUQ78340.1 hypothetical protein ELZ22_17170 [Brucella abortus]RUQ88260.1 hypothetical protein ELZ18_15470 [Brucella abortus]RUQ90289.1 hypothetical protein ELZ20_15465 [Brucella abortus]
MALLRSVEDARRFALAGRAVLTLTSRRTGARFTYRVRRAEDKDDLHFVGLLTGPDNTGDFTYIGVLSGGRFRLTAKSRSTMEAPSVRAVDFFARKVLCEGVLPEELEVRHEGRCGRCGRALTVPESIDRGIGPECQHRV